MSENPYEPPQEVREPAQSPKDATPAIKSRLVVLCLLILAIPSGIVAAFIACGVASEVARPIQDSLYPVRVPHDDMYRTLMRMLFAGVPVSLAAIVLVAFAFSRLMKRWTRT